MKLRSGITDPVIRKQFEDVIFELDKVFSSPLFGSQRSTLSTPFLADQFANVQEYIDTTLAASIGGVTLAGLGGVPTSRTVNGHALTADVTVSKSDVGLSLVENTALSTWAGSANITTLGTVTIGSFPAANLSGTTLAAAVVASSLTSVGTDCAMTTPKITTGIKSSAGNTLIGFTLTGSGNWLTIETTAAGSFLKLKANTGGTNEGFHFINSGTGIFRVQNLSTGATLEVNGGGSSASIQFTTGGTFSSRAFMSVSSTLWQISNATAAKAALIVNLPATGTPTTNQFTIGIGTAGLGPTISATGDDTNIPLNLEVKGTNAASSLVRMLTTSNSTDFNVFRPVTPAVGEILAGSTVSSARSLNIRADYANGAAGNKVILTYYNGTHYSALEYNNTAAGVFSDVYLLKSGGMVTIGRTAAPTARLHLPAVGTAASSAPIKFDSGTLMTAAEVGTFEYNGRLQFTDTDAARRFVVLAAASTKTTAAAPYTNDGYIVVNINGTDVKLMTTA